MSSFQGFEVASLIHEMQIDGREPFNVALTKN